MRFPRTAISWRRVCINQPLRKLVVSLRVGTITSTSIRSPLRMAGGRWARTRTREVDFRESSSLALATPRRRISSTNTSRWLFAGGSLPVLSRFVTSAIPSTTVGRRPQGRAMSPISRNWGDVSATVSVSGVCERTMGEVQPDTPTAATPKQTIRTRRTCHSDGILPISVPDLDSSVSRWRLAPREAAPDLLVRGRDTSLHPARPRIRRNSIRSCSGGQGQPLCRQRWQRRQRRQRWPADARDLGCRSRRVVSAGVEGVTAQECAARHASYP